MLRVLVIDESHTRAGDICASLALAGHQVAAVLPSAIDLVRHVEATRPDVILIETDSPTRDTLEHLSVLDRANPRPIVMFAQDADSQAIRKAVQAGVSAYVVDGVEASRIKPVLDVAVAQFESHLALRNELAQSNRKLAERKLVDRAKGMLMKARSLSEDDAYHALRKLAMERGKTIAAVSQDVIDMANLLL
ncbi:MAG TPA: ANTAR domain-containing protein [Rhodocyclaceae bacterium]|nr:ANTAR domain-containing protein [Rhodocyclaceae bacterium]HMV54041.1 ANTAR domain-containing protein [Rhodocyclaceae bacterium]HMZ82863.1 ANTAR domain-containing protein [Rhodocyclaceae bacterium]HNA02773.1 ANTAR domain-containing protein [Rhodocyclaceae bacterium]HNB78329.1 ANTAR domain-containing protein [Rhodocyclaceae bacterium]